MLGGGKAALTATLSVQLAGQPATHLTGKCLPSGLPSQGLSTGGGTAPRGFLSSSSGEEGVSPIEESTQPLHQLWAPGADEAEFSVLSLSQTLCRGLTTRADPTMATERSTWRPPRLLAQAPQGPSTPFARGEGIAYQWGRPRCGWCRHS